MKKLSLIACFILSILSAQQLNAQSAWWRYSRLPDGGNITDATSDNSGTVYVLSSMKSDIFYTTDNGLQWQKIPGTQLIWDIRGIAVDKPTGTLYAGTTGFGLQWTADKGITWHFEYFFTDPTTGYHASFRNIGVKDDNSVIIANSPPDDMIPPSGNEISTDGGISWNSFVAPYGVANKFRFVSAGRLLAATENGVFRSADNGVTWVAINTGMSGKFTTGILEKISNGHLFASANLNFGSTDTTGCGVFKSVDGGATWINCSIGITDRRISGLDIDGVGTLYAASEGGMYVSHDEGNTWTLVNTGLETVHMTCVAATAAGVFAGSARSGVSYSAYPVSGWESRNKGLSPTSFGDMTINRSGTIHVNDGNISGVYKLSAPNTWAHQFNNLPESYGQYITDQYGTMFTSLSKGNRGIYKSTDGGTTWTEISPVISSPFYLVFSPVKMDSLHHIIYTLVTFPLFVSSVQQQVFSSTDGGATWNTLLTAFDTSTLRYHDINLTSTGDLYVTAADFNTEQLIPLLSTDFGVTFSPVAVNFPTFWAPGFFYLSIDRHDSLYLVQDQRIFRRNGINNWDTLHHGGWTNSPLYLSFDNNNKIFVGTNYEGVFYSADDSTFTPLSDGIPTYTDIWGMPYKIAIFDICFDSDNTPYAMGVPSSVVYTCLADTLQGIYTFSTPPPLTTTVPQKTNKPAAASLYPNPFTKEITLSFTLQNNGSATATLYDLTGRWIRNVINGNYNSGQNSCTVNMQNLSNGIYVLKLRTNEGEQCMKVMKE